VDPRGEPGWVRFSVADTGIGIAAGQIEMIFERFTQADSSTTRKYGGSGLGLAISKGLAELMGGRIGCSSEVGKGSTFFVTAPFGVGSLVQTVESIKLAATPIAPVIPVPAGPVYRILIAEDSEFNLLLIKAYLADSGFELDFAENGKVAVEKMISGSPDLVLMDMQMPVMDGLEATRAIRQWEVEVHARPVPIFALTAHAAEEGFAKSLEAGCTEHFTKPIKKATLVDAIARHLVGKIRITPPRGIEGLIPAYLASIRREMNEILAGLDLNNCAIVRRLGHQFKGSGAGYGFPEIARTGAAVELAAIASNGEEVRRQIRALAGYLDRVEIAT
jgi:CheY-like chemotaxis protein